MVAAAVVRQAAAMVHARALAALARGALVDDDEGDAFGCVRLLLTELAAALQPASRRRAAAESSSARSAATAALRGPVAAATRW